MKYDENIQNLFLSLIKDKEEKEIFKLIMSGLSREEILEKTIKDKK